MTWLLVTVLVIVPSGGGTYSPVALLAGILAVALFIPGIIAVAIARSAGWLRRAGVGRVVAFSLRADADPVRARRHLRLRHPGHELTGGPRP